MDATDLRVCDVLSGCPWSFEDEFNTGEMGISVQFTLCGEPGKVDGQFLVHDKPIAERNTIDCTVAANRIIIEETDENICNRYEGILIGDRIKGTWTCTKSTMIGCDATREGDTGMFVLKKVTNSSYSGDSTSTRVTLREQQQDSTGDAIELRASESSFRSRHSSGRSIRSSRSDPQRDFTEGSGRSSRAHSEDTHRSADDSCQANQTQSDFSRDGGSTQAPSEHQEVESVVDSIFDSPGSNDYPLQGLASGSGDCRHGHPCRPCRFFASGECRNSDNCGFCHRHRLINPSQKKRQKIELRGQRVQKIIKSHTREPCPETDATMLVASSHHGVTNETLQASEKLLAAQDADSMINVSSSWSAGHTAMMPVNSSDVNDTMDSVCFTPPRGRTTKHRVGPTARRKLKSGSCPDLLDTPTFSSVVDEGCVEGSKTPDPFESDGVLNMNFELPSFGNSCGSVPPFPVFGNEAVSSKDEVAEVFVL